MVNVCNTYDIFCSCPLVDNQNRHRQTNLGELEKIDLAKNSVKNCKCTRQHFSSPLKELSCFFYPRTVVTPELHWSKKIRSSGAFFFWENEPLIFQMPIPPYKFTFCTLGLWFNLFWVLEGQMISWRHTVGHFLCQRPLLGPS